MRVLIGLILIFFTYKSFAACGGGTLDDLSGDDLFEQMLRQPIGSGQPKTPPPTPKEQLKDSGSAYKEAKSDYEETLEDPNHSAIDLDNKRRSMEHQERQVQRFKNEVSPKKETEDIDGQSLFEEVLAKTPDYKSTARATNSEGVKPEDLGLSSFDELLQGKKVDDSSSDIVSAIVDEGKDSLFEEILNQTTSESRASSRVAQGYRQLENASPSRPLESKWLSSTTGVERDIKIIGFEKAAPGDESRLLIRYDTGERIVTRKIRSGEIGADTRDPIAQALLDDMQKSSDDAQKVAQQVVRNTFNREKELADIERKLTSGGDGNFEGLVNKKIDILKTEEPLSWEEIRQIENIQDAYSGKNLARRIPLNVDENGFLRIRKKQAFHSDNAGLTKKEKRDLNYLQNMLEKRNGALNAIEDKPHYNAIKDLTENNLYKQRIKKQRSRYYNSVKKFTGYSGGDLPRTPQFNKYEPGTLAKAYSSGTSRKKQALESIHSIMRKKGLSSDDVGEVRKSLRELNRSPAQSQDLEDFLTYTRERIAIEELDRLKSSF